MSKQIISIHGVPRSGTSWLAHLFNSCEEVRFRYQPLFAYRFKHHLQLDSTQEDVQQFFHDLYHLDYDEFIFHGEHQLRTEDGSYHEFDKVEAPSHLVIKMVRYHFLVKKFLKEVPNLKIVGIVRNPNGVINSWMKAPKEFENEWDKMTEWRHAINKNAGRAEEYYGFEKWKEIASLFLDLEAQYPKRFYLVKYEDLVADTLAELEKVFHFCGLEVTNQVRNFVNLSHSKELGDHPYSVFRFKDVAKRWEKELEPTIMQQITEEVNGTPLARFL